MKTGKIIEGKPFDWARGAEASKHVVREDGEINWRAACSADPGCSSCPACGEYHWREGIVIECATCGAHYNHSTYPAVLVKAGREPTPVERARVKEQE